jgi:arylsulfatase A-like enzyme
MRTRPNIVLILADDMGYGDFGCFSEGRATTPTLDQLVRDGLCLTQHYSASPVCAPARASLLTGRYPHRTGAIDTCARPRRRAAEPALVEGRLSARRSAPPRRSKLRRVYAPSAFAAV